VAIRVLHALQTIDSGGIATGVLSLIAQLRAPDFEHVIAVETEPGADRRAILAGVPVQVIAPRAWPLLLPRILALRRLLHAQRIGVVHGRGWPAVDALVAGASLPGLGLILSEHGRPAARMRRRPLPQRFLLRWLGRRLSAAFGLAPDLAAELAHYIGWPESAVEVVGNGVDTGRFHPAAQANRKHGDTRIRVGVAGDLRPVKRPDLVIEMQRRLARIPDGGAVELEIAGGGPLLGELQVAIESQNLRGRVHLRGPVADMPGWYRSLDVVVVASDYEGCSNVVLEAMASGVPVIATNVGSNAALVGGGDAGIVVPPNDVNALLQAVRTLIRDPGLRHRLGACGRGRTLSSYALPTVAQHYAEIYRLAAIRASDSSPLSFGEYEP
jgi:glycosyltransferase involved in cell wall biosynthesis